MQGKVVILDFENGHIAVPEAPRYIVQLASGFFFLGRRRLFRLQSHDTYIQLNLTNVDRRR